MLEHARAQIFIFEHARARSMLDYFILDVTLRTHKVTQSFQKIVLNSKIGVQKKATLDMFGKLSGWVYQKWMSCSI